MGQAKTTMGNEWKHNLFGCCDKGCAWWCINLYCCGPCNLGRAAEISHQSSCILYCCCAGCCLGRNRMKVADKSGINESCYQSCMLAWCCACCTAAQIIMEVEDDKGMRAGCLGNWTGKCQSGDQTKGQA